MKTVFDFDTFLDDATHVVSDLWKARGGPELDLDAETRLNDVLAEFFNPLSPHKRLTVDRLKETLDNDAQRT